METPSNLMTPTIFAETLTLRLSDLANVEVHARYGMLNYLDSMALAGMLVVPVKGQMQRNLVFFLLSRKLCFTILASIILNPQKLVCGA